MQQPHKGARGVAQPKRYYLPFVVALPSFESSLPLVAGGDPEFDGSVKI